MNDTEWATLNVWYVCKKIGQVHRFYFAWPEFMYIQCIWYLVLETDADSAASFKRHYEFEIGSVDGFQYRCCLRLECGNCTQKQYYSGQCAFNCCRNINNRHLLINKEFVCFFLFIKSKSGDGKWKFHSNQTNKRIKLKRFCVRIPCAILKQKHNNQRQTVIHETLDE